MSNVKVSILEKDGIEYDGPVEHELTASEVDFDSDGLTWTEAQETQTAIEDARADALSRPRYSIPCIMNGTMSNGDYIRYSNLASNPEIMIPIDSDLAEVTYSNNNSSADFDIVFYKNQTTTPFTTVEIRNSIDGVISGFAEIFDSGSKLYMKYVDKGSNASDLNLIVFMRAR